MQFSLTLILLAIELGFLFMLAWRCGRLAPAQGNIGPVYTYLLWITAFGVIPSILGARGVYISDDLLKTLPGLTALVPSVVAKERYGPASHRFSRPLEGREGGTRRNTVRRA